LAALEYALRNSLATKESWRTLSFVHLRQANPGDELSVAQVHVRSWQLAYRRLLPDEYLDALEPADRAAGYTFADAGPNRPLTVVTVNEDVICGFATVGRCRDPDVNHAGELYAIYVHPDWWNRGVGRMLIHDARRRLAELGVSTAVLWVLVGNERAEHFYRTDGWWPDGQRRLQKVQGITVDEIRYSRTLN
jgi:GNAT superfamily N-acetyltransferase